MKRISLSTILEREAEDCEKSAALNSSPHAEVFHILAISYRSLARRLRDEATPFKETDASKNT